MTARIEWYTEVLASDPSSKLFFPLARCLFDKGDEANAVSVLRKGLLVHPDFLEARCLLVEILLKQGMVDEAQAEARKVARTLKAYPGLWEALERAETREHADDALMWRLFSMLVSGRGLSLTDILSRGLAALEQERNESASRVAQEAAADPTPVVPVASEKQPSLEDLPDSMPFSPAVSVPVPDTPETAPADPFPIENDIPQDSHEIPLHEASSVSTDTDEAINLRTRSMADVLAEQGDLSGAIIIYEELLSAEPGSASLRRRIAELRRQLSEGSEKKVFAYEPEEVDEEQDEELDAAELPSEPEVLNASASADPDSSAAEPVAPEEPAETAHPADLAEEARKPALATGEAEENVEIDDDESDTVSEPVEATKETADIPAAQEKPAAVIPSADGLESILATLADRLEARARRDE